jgi:ribosomal protein L11 methyltransferase
VTELAEPENVRKVEQEHPGRIVLSFPPQLAFGTGAHPTTASCLRFLVDAAKRRNGQAWNLVDLGCGSGILAIAAAKLGATNIVAIENDAMALGYARENAERHGVADRIEFLCEDAIAWMHARERGSIQVVAANLFSELLIELMPAIPAALAPGGEIILSGFLTSQTRDVVEASKSCGMPLTDFLRRGKWVAGWGG